MGSGFSSSSHTGTTAAEGRDREIEVGEWGKEKRFYQNLRSAQKGFFGDFSGVLVPLPFKR